MSTIFGYIKKSDYREAVRTNRVFNILALISVSTTIAVMQLYVIPKLKILYDGFAIQPTLQMTVAPYVFWGIAICSLSYAIFITVRKPDYQKMEKKLSQYSEDEMIKASDVINYRFSASVLIILILIGISMVHTYMYPIYTFTEKLNSTKNTNNILPSP